MQFVQYVSGVNINNLTCSNMWAGVAPYLPDSASFGDFTIENSQFSNIGTDAITTYGQWSDYGLRGCIPRHRWDGYAFNRWNVCVTGAVVGVKSR
jgi:hypothetical protein